jgi:hypothetical protein
MASAASLVAPALQYDARSRGHDGGARPEENMGSVRRKTTPRPEEAPMLPGWKVAMPRMGETAP